MSRVERFMYAASVPHLPARGQDRVAFRGHRTVMRPATFTAYATSAGFSNIEIIPIQHDLFRFYRLTP